MKTHLVLDTFYTPDEGQECFSGTLEECTDFITEQGGAIFLYKIVEMTQAEYEWYNREKDNEELD